jgi:outer membrane receptor protein involved in Fe transport
MGAPALAQTDPTPGVVTDQNGVTIYRPSFFASAQPTTALDMINRLPGFIYDPGDSVRGFAGAASNVLIDGARPAAKSDTTDSILSRIPAGDVDHIALIRGAVPGVDMHGRNVMANVVRKTVNKTEIIGSVQDNVFLNDGHTVPGGSLQITSHFGERNIEAQVSRYSNFDDSVGNGTIDTITQGGGPGTGDVRENAHNSGAGGGVGITGSYSGPDLGGTLRINVKLEETYFHQGLDYGLPPDTVVNDESRNRDGEIGFNWEKTSGPWDLQLIGLQHLERDSTREWSTEPGDVSYDNQNQRFGESIGRVVLRYDWTPALTLQGGGEFVYNYLYGNEFYIDEGVQQRLPSDDVFVDERRGEAFGQATWKIMTGLTLESGARFEFSNIAESGDVQNNRTFFYPKPRFLLTWDPFTSTEVRLRVERKVGQLNFSNFVSAVDLNTGGLVSAGNPNLRPDDHWQFEAAVEQRFWGKGSVVITGLHEQIAEVNDYVPIPGSTPPVDGPGNIGSGTSDQLDIEGNLPLDPFGVKGGRLKTTTLWRISSVEDPITHQDRRISGQRPDQIQAEYDQDMPGWKSTFSLIWFKGWRETYYRIDEVDHYHIGPQYMQLEWDYKPTRDLLLAFQADNILPFKFYRYREVWDTVRNFSPVDYNEFRTIQAQPRLYVRIRKTLF